MKNQFWAIRTEKGYFYPWTLSYTRRDAIKKFEIELASGKFTWEDYRIKRGFRCVKVKVVLVKT